MKKLEIAKDYINAKLIQSSELSDDLILDDEQILYVPEMEIPDWLKDVKIDLSEYRREIECLSVQDELASHN